MSNSSHPVTGVTCPKCGTLVETYRNPAPTVDTIIELNDPPYTGMIVLIERGNPPYGWAIPGGFIDYGESAEDAAVREAAEEVSLEIELIGQLGTYSDPNRDARRHTISVVYCARAGGVPVAADDAKSAGIFSVDELPENMCFDHGEILRDYVEWRRKFSA